MPKRIETDKRFNALKQEHNKFVPSYRDLSDYVNPVRGIFNGDRTKIGKMIDHKKLLAAHATHAQRIFASGLNSGMTNKSTEWFRFSLGNQELLEIPGVRGWLDQVKKVMYDVLNQSNIYEVFYSTYEELGQFGTGCFLVLEDFDDIVRFRSFTAGEYFLGTNNKGMPNAFGREFEMTVEQLVIEFGLESCSPQVQSNFKNNLLDVKIKVGHLIEENVGRNPDYADMKNMAFRSCYWELGQGDQYLAVRGYKRFPVIAPRWDTITTDMVYGYGPGWGALGAIKELQATTLDKMYAQAKIHNPPVVADASVQGHESLLPGGITRSSSNQTNAGVRAAYEVRADLSSYIESINGVKEEIDKFFFVNLFMMIATLDDRQRTAEEIATRQQEKMMMIGPALHRLDKEMLSPVLELVYSILEDNRLIPEPPEEMDGITLKIEFTSGLAQAQKAVGIDKINKVIMMAGSLAQIGKLEALDNLDGDEIIRETQDMEGASAKIVLDAEMVAKIRADRMKQQNQAMAMQAANSGADTAQKLAGATVGGEEKNMLDVVGQAVGGR